MDAMSKKEKLARGSAVIKVMRVNPRPGHFLKSYVDPRKLPKAPKVGGLKGVLADMPHLDVKNAYFEFSPRSAKVPGELPTGPGQKKDVCDAGSLNNDKVDPSKLGLPDGDKMMGWFGYNTWLNAVNPLNNSNIAEHFNIMLGLLISMAEDSENENFADAEAYPCVQFLKTIKTPDGEIPYNCMQLIGYIEYICQKMLDEGARGSAVIKVMRVNPRPGHFLKTYIDPRKLPKAPKAGGLKGVLADMPHLDVKNAYFEFSPRSAKVQGPPIPAPPGSKKDVCDAGSMNEPEDPTKIGLPEGDKMMDWFGYHTWLNAVNPLYNGNIAEHFNIMLGLLISMSEDAENENFADVEAYPCVQFLKTIKTPDGEIPYNCLQLIGYIEYICQKMLDEG